MRVVSVVAMLVLPLAGQSEETVSPELAATDHFSKIIRWENTFDPVPGTAEPTRCLLRIQHRKTGDPLDWAPAVLLYRLAPQAPLLLRICQLGPSHTLEDRQEYDYTASKPISGGKHTFTLEFTGATTKEQGKIRLLMDGVAVLWKDAKVTSFPDKQVLSTRSMATETITGDAPTLFPSEGRWIANGDPSQGAFTYRLLAISTPP